jgi:hypothetical protein
LASLLRIGGAISLTAYGWFAVVVTLTFMSAPGKSMAIVGPQTLAAVARAKGRILASSRYVTIARSDDSRFVAHLYAAGALLDAEQAGGCSGLPPKRIAAL